MIGLHLLELESLMTKNGTLPSCDPGCSWCVATEGHALKIHTIRRSSSNCTPWVIYLHTMSWKHTIIQWRLWVHGLMGGNENPTSITPWMRCSDQPYMGLLWPPTMQLAWLQNYISLNYKTGNSDCGSRQSYFSGRILIMIAVLCTRSVHRRRRKGTAINRTVLVMA